MNNSINSTNGMKTMVWGPAAWTFLFCSVIGAYPVKLDESNKDHIKIKKEFKSMFQSFGYTMPCIYCRESYKKFTADMPIDDHMGTRLSLISWLYKLKDKVNKKLIKQELDCLKSEHAKLLEKYESKKIDYLKYKTQLKHLKDTIMITKPSPSLKSVIDKYNKYRAGCSVKYKTCR
jgi:hypothetical protein